MMKYLNVCVRSGPAHCIYKDKFSYTDGKPLRIEHTLQLLEAFVFVPYLWCVFYTFCLLVGVFPSEP